MSAEKDITLDEKRVYGDKVGATRVFVATGVGLARVAVSDGLVGEYGLARRGEATDVTASEGRLAVATPEDALVGTGGDFAETGFGPATAVGYGGVRGASDGGQADGPAGGALLAAGDGRIARYDADRGDEPASPDRWKTVAEVDDVRALSGDLAATAGGVVRLGEGRVGLDDARDVTAEGDLLAATADGLYYLANGWMEAVGGGFRAVAAEGGERTFGSRSSSDERSESEGDRAAAVADDGTLYLRDGEWAALDAPSDDLADVAISDGVVYAVSTDGTLYVEGSDVVGGGSADGRDAGPADGWRSRALGLPDARRLAVA